MASMHRCTRLLPALGVALVSVSCAGAMRHVVVDGAAGMPPDSVAVVEMRGAPNVWVTAVDGRVVDADTPLALTLLPGRHEILLHYREAPAFVGHRGYGIYVARRVRAYGLGVRLHTGTLSALRVFSPPGGTGREFQAWLQPLSTVAPDTVESEVRPVARAALDAIAARDAAGLCALVHPRLGLRVLVGGRWRDGRRLEAPHSDTVPAAAVCARLAAAAADTSATLLSRWWKRGASVAHSRLLHVVDDSYSQIAPELNREFPGSAGVTYRFHDGDVHVHAARDPAGAWRIVAVVVD